jgi:hypothetical protein
MRINHGRIGQVLGVVVIADAVIRIAVHVAQVRTIEIGELRVELRLGLLLGLLLVGLPRLP